MTGLVDLVFPDGVIALSSIVKIGEPREVRRSWGSSRVRDVSCADGSTHSLGVPFVDGLLRRPMQLMPAEPGTFALHVWGTADDGGVNRTPVIAWALCVDGEVRPVTPQGVNNGGMMRDGEGYVLMPNGSVQSVGEHADEVWFDSVEDYCAGAWEREKAIRAARKAAPATNDGVVA